MGAAGKVGDGGDDASLAVLLGEGEGAVGVVLVEELDEAAAGVLRVDEGVGG